MSVLSNPPAQQSMARRATSRAGTPPPTSARDDQLDVSPPRRPYATFRVRRRRSWTILWCRTECPTCLDCAQPIGASGSGHAAHRKRRIEMRFWGFILIWNRFYSYLIGPRQVPPWHRSQHTSATPLAAGMLTPRSLGIMRVANSQRNAARAAFNLLAGTIMTKSCSDRRFARGDAARAHGVVGAS